TVAMSQGLSLRRVLLRGPGRAVLAGTTQRSFGSRPTGPQKPEAKARKPALAGGGAMRRAIAKQSRVRTIGTRRLPSQLKREGRALPGLHAVPNRTERRKPLGGLTPGRCAACSRRRRGPCRLPSRDRALRRRAGRTRPDRPPVEARRRRRRDRACPLARAV